MAYHPGDNLSQYPLIQAITSKSADGLATILNMIKVPYKILGFSSKGSEYSVFITSPYVIKIKET